MTFEAYVSMAVKACAALTAEKSGIQRALSAITSPASGLQNLRSCGTTHRYWCTYLRF